MVAFSFLPMKRFAALLIAVTTSAHAQFAVMHTNGAVTSPTNLTIQQSNVAGLSNALAGKLGTNGSASGLTGFVGTTNAETARGNLGISNTFAGQFHADYFDNFVRYTNGAVISNGVAPLVGPNYRLTVLGTNVAPSITNGLLRSTNGGIWYLTTDLPRPVYNFGGEVSFDQSSGLNRAVFIINSDTNVFGKMLHINFSPVDLGVDVATNGVAGFGSTNSAGINNTIISTNWGGGAQALAPNKRHFVTGRIFGDWLHLKINDRQFWAFHPDLSECAGPHFTIESFYSATNVTNYWHQAWANSPAMQEVSSQPYSDYFRNFTKGNAQVEQYLVVSTNQTSDFDNANSTNPVFVRGGLRASGQLQQLVLGYDYSPVPAVAAKGGTGANTNTTNRTVMYEAFFASSSLINTWSRIKYTFVGSFANTTNEKRVVFEMANGSQLDTGNITNTGEWSVEALFYKTPTNTHEAFAVFRSEATTKMARFAYDNAATFIVQLEGAATTNNEVILRGAWADWYP
jgi:hypothetical protein